MNRALFTVGAAGILTLLAPSVSAAQGVDDVVVSVEPSTAAVVLGADIEIVVTVTNTGAASSPALVAHIDITDPGEDGSVDPEDWTSTLSKPVGVLRPGETATVDWRIQPISAGVFSLYAIALSPESDRVAASNVLRVAVDDQRSLNPDNILPVAIAAPAAVGGLLLLQLRGGRRRSGRRGRR